MQSYVEHSHYANQQVRPSARVGIKLSALVYQRIDLIKSGT